MTKALNGKIADSRKTPSTVIASGGTKRQLSSVSANTNAGNRNRSDALKSPVAKVMKKNFEETESFQVRNALTGHWIKKNAATGKFVVNNTNKPFRGIPVRRTFTSASNPSITKEIAFLAEKAVLEVLNNKK